MDFLSSLVSAGSSLLGGLMGQKSAKDALAAQQAMNNQNIQAQYDFAEHGLSWKEADARSGEKQYGINPLVALGAPTSSFSNITGSFPADNSMGQAVEGAGKAFAGALNREESLKEDLLKAQIANVNSDTVKNQAAASGMVTKKASTPPQLYTQVIDRDGRTRTIMDPKFATSFQRLGAYPEELGAAVRDTAVGIGGQLSSDFSHVKDWMKSFGSPPVRGDVWRDSVITAPFNQ